jgi:hypothetical protein
LPYLQNNFSFCEVLSSQRTRSGLSALQRLVDNEAGKILIPFTNGAVICNLTLKTGVVRDMARRLLLHGFCWQQTTFQSANM